MDGHGSRRNAERNGRTATGGVEHAERREVVEQWERLERGRADRGRPKYIIYKFTWWYLWTAIDSRGQWWKVNSCKHAGAVNRRSSPRMWALVGCEKWKEKWRAWYELGYEKALVWSCLLEGRRRWWCRGKCAMLTQNCCKSQLFRCETGHELELLGSRSKFNDWTGLLCL